LLRERLVGLFDNIDVSGLGVCDSFYGFWEPGHGCVEDGGSGAKDLKVYFNIYENDPPPDREGLVTEADLAVSIHPTVPEFPIPSVAK